MCCLTASRSVYKLIPASGSGSPATNYDSTTYGYDPLKRLVQTISPGGTITWNVLDPRGLILAIYVGTNDSGGTYTDPTGGGAPGNNMVLVTTNVLDGGVAGGDGNLTGVVQQVDSTTTRTTLNIYDFRNRLIAIDGEIDYYAVYYYDNMNRQIEFQRYNTTGPFALSSSRSSSSSASTIGNLIMQTATNFDDRSRVYQSIIYAVNPTTGVVGNALTDNLWFDASGNQIKSWSAGSQLFQKAVYDSLGRQNIQGGFLICRG